MGARQRGDSGMSSRGSPWSQRRSRSWFQPPPARPGAGEDGVPRGSTHGASLGRETSFHVMILN